jgi:hypothetical protein
MASLIVNTGVESHPQISIDAIDMKSEQITFRWLNSAYSGDCSEPFTITLADHGTMTLNAVAAAVAAHMVGLLSD